MTNEKITEINVNLLLIGTKINDGTLAIENSIDCSGLSSGVYLLNLTDGFGNVSVLKFIKQ